MFAFGILILSSKVNLPLFILIYVVRRLLKVIKMRRVVMALLQTDALVS